MRSGVVYNGILGEDDKVFLLVPDVLELLPIYNEVDSLLFLLEAISSILIKSEIDYEIICVDDGSSDGSATYLREEATKRNDLRAVILRRNYGQTAAMSAGFHHALGKTVVTLDGDLQNDPADIPMLLAKLEEGYDLVSGWRKKRQDKALTRLLPSKIANWLIGRITSVKLHDYGCSLKAYRGELVADMNLYGELHRFLPALAYIEGARIVEVPVRHHARRFGSSKYGLWRTFRVLMDLLTIAFMKKFLSRPMHVFGLWGLIFMMSGGVMSTYLTWAKLVLGQDIGEVQWSHEYLPDLGKISTRSRYWRSPFIDFSGIAFGDWGTAILLRIIS